MSCKKCDEAQDDAENGTIRKGIVGMSPVRFKGKAFYRWKNANIEVNGCDEHLREVFDALNEVQKNGRKNQP